MVNSESKDEDSSYIMAQALFQEHTGLVDMRALSGFLIQKLGNQ
jgi:hypothetical protein